MIALQRPGFRHTDEWIRAVRRSRILHRSWVTPPSDRATYHRYVGSLRRRDRTGFLVVTADTGDLVGVINVSEIVRGLFQSAHLGYYAFMPFAGRGLMRLGLRQVIQACFRDLGLHRLEANTQPGNERSVAVIEGLGFRKEGYSPRYLKVCGRWRDHERWAILADFPELRRRREG